jgi:hypothetical protein
MNFFNMANFWDTLRITGWGMLGIFAVMVIIYAIILVLDRVTKD